MEIIWDATDEAGWRAELPGSAAALQQSWRYGAALGALGRQVHRGEVFACGRRLAMVQLVQRGLPVGARLGYLPRGPVWLGDPPQSVRHKVLGLVSRSMPGRRPSLLLAVPDVAATGLVPLMTPQWLAELELLPDTAAMRRRMHGKWRNRLVGAEKSGLRVVSTLPSSDVLERLAKREEAQRRARHYRGLPLGFLRAWQGVGKGGARLYAAQRRGAVLAQMLFLDHDPGVTYQIGWTSDQGRDVSAHHLLLWRAMQDFARAGRRRLDLGTLDTVSTPGLARFKLGAGAEARKLGAAGIVLPMLRLRCAAEISAPALQ
ncbi:MAG: GNAT family N-acetyltransferase [Rhodobacteraceae bacterium]|nr:GNAT family N-acetyltransferase [Paracoccaceae bacterium]